MLFRFFSLEIRDAFRNWSLYLPSLITGTLGLFVFSFVLKNAYGTNISKSFSLGWLTYGATISALVFSVMIVLDLKLSKTLYYLHLPIKRTYVAFIKILVGSLIATIIGLFFTLILLLFGYVEVSNLPLVVGVVFIETLAIGGLMITPGFLIKNIEFQSLFSSALSGILQYLSPIFAPIDTFPEWLRVVLYLNPLTPAISLIRSEGDFSFHLFWLILLMLVYGLLSVYFILRHLGAEENRLRISGR
jgi:ABC-type polysaccharide/polyol phosphate export permease